MNEITNLVGLHHVDVLMLVECQIPVADVLLSLNPVDAPEFHFTESFCEKIHIYTRFPGQFIKPVLESGRFSVRRIALPGQTEILLAAVHFPSKVNWSDADQAAESHELAKSIRVAEQETNCHNTVLVGDLNMNPFEDGVVTANGLNAAMTRQIAFRKTREVQGQHYPFFYNPMWGLFGDATEGPSGTHYYTHSGHKAFFWHMYDQVLIRPGLLSLFQNRELKILTRDGKRSLVSKGGLPNVSDHLPLLFKLSL